MKFLVDAQLPYRFVRRLMEANNDALHTRDLPAGNRTTDQDVLVVAARDQRIVVTKDTDFVNSFHLQQQPEKLLLISTGNIKNADLDILLLSNLDAIIAAFQQSNFVELTRTALVVHG